MPQSYYSLAPQKPVQNEYVLAGAGKTESSLDRASAATWGMHRHPLGKDDAMYLLWQYRDCCQTASQ